MPSAAPPTIQLDSIDIVLSPKASAIAQCASIVAPWSKPIAQVHRELISPIDGPRDDPRAMSSDTKSKLLAAIARARGWLDDLISGRVPDIDEIAAREKRSARSASMLLSLAFIAPDLVKAVAESRLPRGIGLTRMMNLPSDWAEQRKALGLQPRL